MRRDDRPQPRRKVAGRRLLEDPDLLGLPGRCSSIKTAGAPSQRPRHETLSTLTRASPPNSRGDRFEPGEATGRASEVAGDVAADVNLDIRRRLQPEVGKEADHLVNPVQRDIEPGREPLDLLPRQVADSFLDRTKLADEHEISRRSIKKGGSAFDAGSPSVGEPPNQPVDSTGNDQSVSRASVRSRIRLCELRSIPFI